MIIVSQTQIPGNYYEKFQRMWCESVLAMGGFGAYVGLLSSHFTWCFDINNKIKYINQNVYNKN